MSFLHHPVQAENSQTFNSQITLRSMKAHKPTENQEPETLSSNCHKRGAGRLGTFVGLCLSVRCERKVQRRAQFVLPVAEVLQVPQDSSPRPFLPKGVLQPKGLGARFGVHR